MLAVTHAICRAIARYMEALLESRMQSANREIAMYAHMLPKHRNDSLPFNGL